MCSKIELQIITSTMVQKYRQFFGDRIKQISSFGENENGIFTYFAGASATPGTTAYDDFVTWELHPAEYIVCSFEAESFVELLTSVLEKSMNYLFGTWLPKHNLSTQPFSAEKYINVNPEMCKMELWVIPVPITEQESR